MSILKWQVNSFSIFVSFFIVMTHNTSVNFNLIHFPLWTNRSHQSPNSETFKCSGENEPYSSCHFPNHKSVFLQILHHFSALWKITPLHLFGKTLNTFHFKDFRAFRTIFDKILSFLKQQVSFSSNFASIFKVMRHNPHVLF